MNAWLFLLSNSEILHTVEWKFTRQKVTKLWRADWF